MQGNGRTYRTSVGGWSREVSGSYEAEMAGATSCAHGVPLAIANEANARADRGASQVFASTDAARAEGSRKSVVRG